ncbi:hypothetical protein HPP92_022392 [Vanilla planifolia]|uniref:BTB domain-containing protein n=1 Tax=Vanilla planifolia TaxID=51239 RepID=A0A835UDR8_VANPL|nr:hypothetical protein HPP92_022392 [Vanilla planifolia]
MEMAQKKQRFLTVAPFKCEWDEDLRFKEAGRGCVAFEAFAQNDVTLVFREQVGSQRYHYKMDNCPNYTVILGSHRNRRLKIEVNGKAVVDVAGVGLCCSSSFQSYWISIYDGQISIGKGKYPFQDTVLQWIDSEPNYSVQYVGLSSWDKHVRYRNIFIFPLNQHYSALWRQIEHKEYESHNVMEHEIFDINDDHATCGLLNFLESWDFSDVIFLVGSEKLVVPAHKVILNCYGNFSFSSFGENIVHLPSTTYAVMHAFLEYIYTGRTQIVESQLHALRDLSGQFEVMSLIKLCEGISDRFKTNKKLFDCGKKVEILNASYDVQQCGIFPCAVPAAIRKLKHFLATGEHSDVNIYVEGHGLIARSHKLILSIWSSPFEKMFTNGMVESKSASVTFKDVPSEAFSAMLQFMYCGELELDIDGENMASFLIPLVLLADKFGINHLQRECCKLLLECLSEDTVCPILLAIASVPSCKVVEEACKRNFSMHFDYCTTSSIDFVFFDDYTFKDILQHTDLTVTSEERVLDAILMWCMHASENFGWARVDQLLSSLTPEQLFGRRFLLFDKLLPLVRFPLMPSHLLTKLEKSRLSGQIVAFGVLVKEAVQYCGVGPKLPVTDQKFQHRSSSFKELLYICDGDNNGVIYFTGTSYGEHQWVNPVLAKKIVVTASTPPCRYTDPKALVSRVFQATSFSGPRVEDGRSCAWWMVDIGQNHQLMCNYYTLRLDGSTNFQGHGHFRVP